MTTIELATSDDDDQVALTKDNLKRWSPLAHLTSAKLLLNAKLPVPNDGLVISASKDAPRPLRNPSTIPYPTKRVRDIFFDASPPRLPGSNCSLAVGGHRLPPSIKHAWLDIDEATVTQQSIRDAIVWLGQVRARSSRKEDHEAIDSTITTLLSLPWKDRLLGIDPNLVNYNSLVRLLGESWLGESVVNLSIACTIDAASKRTDRHTSVAYALLPSNCVSVALGRILGDGLIKYEFEAALVREFQLPYKSLVDVRDYIKAHAEVVWFLPICHDDHWLLARFNVLDKSWTLINSMPTRAMKRPVLDALDAVFDVLQLPFRAKDRSSTSLPAFPRQVDSHSCGPAIVNAVESEVLEVDDFDPKRPYLARARQFRRNIEHFDRRNLSSRQEDTSFVHTRVTSIADMGPQTRTRRTTGDPLKDVTNVKSGTKKDKYTAITRTASTLSPNDTPLVPPSVEPGAASQKVVPELSDEEYNDYQSLASSKDTEVEPYVADRPVPSGSQSRPADNPHRTSATTNRLDQLITCDDSDDNEGKVDRSMAFLGKRRRAEISDLSNTEEAADDCFKRIPSSCTPGAGRLLFDEFAEPPTTVRHSIDSLYDLLALQQRALNAMALDIKKIAEAVTLPVLEDVKSGITEAAKIFVATPFLCRHLDTKEVFLKALLKGKVVSKTDFENNKNREYKNAVTAMVPGILSQARSDLERHIKRAVSDKDLLWPTVRKWYKTMVVPISADHMCWWSVLWQVMKGAERDSSTNSFAMKVLDFTMALAEAAAVASMAGKYVVDGSFDQQAFISARLAKAMRRHDVTKRSRPSGQEHVVQRSCSEVVDDEDNEVSFTSLIKEALKPEGSKRKSKKAKRQEKADD